ncbi:outer membrane protein assembly factor BamD [Aggregatibacter actinomycetemcomitans]|uniref:outer membrane protein assembly factor BamD n=1 Tax=Aggregatibacter actinomycetemcomitans TaxID=714 RepID=UPI00197B07DF|nr:outer membrane protein assembly factor BamD [Aggregatibacter actinomycetemcomitans]MBN6075583.1 outer membrane protein assembly factor BamD [Aggregatibacter actinomycetemcomitans]
MRKLKSFALLTAMALVVTGCSGSKQDVEQAPEQTLYATGQTYLQDGDYTQAIRYFNAVSNRFPGSSYGEQVQLNLIYAYYKSQDYNETLLTIDRFIQRYPNSSHLDYALYMAGLTNSALGDNFFQDFFGVDRATRENTSIKTAFANFQNLVNHFPNSPYTPDALARMTYIKASLARHELEIAKFYFKRDAYVATANRVVSMLKLYPDTQATLDALPLMKESYEKLNLKHLADQTAQVIAANEGKKFDDPEKPKEPELQAPQQ